MLDITKPYLIGMIHLPPLPGSPRTHPPLSESLDRALIDAKVLAAAGFDALMIENFGDAPFAATQIDPATIASMAVVASTIRRETNLPIGVNALRNDAISAMGIAAAVDAAFIRVNVLIGVSATDQGFIEGAAAVLHRYRKQLASDVAILADVHVKHAQPISQPDIALAAEETAYRGGADALIASGTTTGRAADPESIAKIKSAVPDRPLLIGSGADATSIRDILQVAEGAIVGTSIKRDGKTTAPVDPDRAKAFITAARSA